jgi:hypothetical protein
VELRILSLDMSRPPSGDQVLLAEVATRTVDRRPPFEQHIELLDQPFLSSDCFCDADNRAEATARKYLKENHL